MFFSIFVSNLWIICMITTIIDIMDDEDTHRVVVCCDSAVCGLLRQLVILSSSSPSHCCGLFVQRALCWWGGAFNCRQSAAAAQPRRPGAVWLHVTRDQCRGIDRLHEQDTQAAQWGRFGEGRARETTSQGARSTTHCPSRHRGRSTIRYNMIQYEMLF